MKELLSHTMLIIILMLFGACATSFATGPSQNDTLNVFELSLENLLNTDVTTASKAAEKQSDAPGIISVVTKDELVRFGGTTLKDVLERVPGLISYGVQFTDLTTIAARGDQVKNTSGHVLLLINGRPVREIHEGGISSEMFNTFPVNIIEKIEVIKGPGSVLYGSDAFSAVINIITEKAEKNSISATGIVQTGGGYGGNGDATVKAGDLNIIVAGRYLEKTEWTAHYNYTIVGTARDTSTIASVPDKGTGAYMGLSYKGLNVMASYNDWNSYLVTGGPSESRKFFTNLGYSQKVMGFWNTDINVTYTNAYFHAPLMVEKRSSYNLVAEWTNFITISSKSKLVIGGLFNKNDGKELGVGNPEPIISKDSRNSYAVYAQLDYRLLKSLKLIGGVQANKVEDIKMNVVPRAGIIWYPVNRLSVKAIYSEAFRAPSINENTINYAGIILGDPDLVPEKVKTIDIGISYQGEQVQVGASYFNSKQSQIIMYDGTHGLVNICQYEQS